MGVFARRSAPHSLPDGARKTISTRKLAPSRIWVKTMAWNCLAPGPETYTRKTQTAEPEVPKCREHPTHKDRPHRPGHPQACGKECEGHDCGCELIKDGKEGRAEANRKRAGETKRFYELRFVKGQMESESQKHVDPNPIQGEQNIANQCCKTRPNKRCYCC